MRIECKLMEASKCMIWMFWICLLMVLATPAHAAGEKIILLDPDGDGGFQNGTGFEANGWTVVNGDQADQWVTGQTFSLKTAYISSDGGANWVYDQSQVSVVHFYRDIFIPADAEEVYLEYWYAGAGERLKDNVRVFLKPMGTEVIAGMELFGPVSETLDIEEGSAAIGFRMTHLDLAVPGTTQRLIFSWVNNGNGQGGQPPATLDRISVSCTRRNPLKDPFSWQNPFPHGNDHTGSTVINSTTAIVTGQAGTLGRTTNGGLTWAFDYLLNGFRSPLVSPVVAGGNVFIVAQPNMLLRSTDLGTSWNSLSQINTDNISVNRIATAGQTIIAVGNAGTVYRSVDGGETFEPVSSSINGDLYSVAFDAGDTTRVIAGGLEGIIIASPDNGASFDIAATGLSIVYDIKSFELGSFVAGTLLGVKKSLDSGNNWTTVQNTGFAAVRGVSVRDALEGAAVAGQGTVFHTLDGWNSVGVKLTGQDDFLETAAFFPNSENVSIAGNAGTLLSTDDFINFDRLSGGVNSYEINDVYYQGDSIGLNPPAVGFAAGNGGTVLKTVDGGDTWAPVTTGVLGTISAISGNGDGLLMAVGSFGQHIRSTDHGESWQPMTIPVSSGINDIHMTGPQSAIAVGNNGTVLQTVDSGQNWTPLTTGIFINLNGLDVLTSAAADTIRGDSLLVAGNSGSIFKSVDGGASWIQKTTPTSSNLLSIEMVDAQVGHAVGVGGTVLRTSDGGETWNLYLAGFPETLNDVSFIGPDVGVVAANNGLVLRTLDACVTWDTLGASAGIDLNSIIMFDPYSLTCIGEQGTILHAEPIEIIYTGIEQSSPRPEVPREFILMQNYPNPFNPSTRIIYQLPVAGEVNLAIYDLLGRPIRQLVGDGLAGVSQPAGYYSLTWDGTNDAGTRVAGGIYFYRMIVAGYGLAGNRFEYTRKMLLSR